MAVVELQNRFFIFDSIFYEAIFIFVKANYFKEIAYLGKFSCILGATSDIRFALFALLPII